MRDMHVEDDVLFLAKDSHTESEIEFHRARMASLNKSVIVFHSSDALNAWRHHCQGIQSANP